VITNFDLRISILPGKVSGIMNLLSIFVNEIFRRSLKKRKVLIGSMLSKVYRSSIAAMGFSYRPSKAFFRLRNGDKMTWFGMRQYAQIATAQRVHHSTISWM